MGAEPHLEQSVDLNCFVEVAFTSDVSDFSLPPCLNALLFSTKIVTFTVAIRLVFVTFAITTFYA